MKDRDDAPPDFSLFRRKTLIGGGLLLGGFAAGTRIPAAPVEDRKSVV